MRIAYVHAHAVGLCASHVFERMFVFACTTYVKTPFPLQVGTANSTHIIYTLAHLGWIWEAHPHSTESPLSFLTGLEREKGRGRSLQGGIVTWHSLNHNLAEIIEVFKLLLVSPSVFPLLCLCRFQARCQFEEKQEGNAC